MVMFDKNLSMAAFVCQRNFQLLPSFYFVVWPDSVTTIPPQTVTDSNDSNIKNGGKSVCFSVNMTCAVFMFEFVYMCLYFRKVHM